MTAPTSPSPDSLAAAVADLRLLELNIVADRVERLDAEMRKEIARCHERLEIDHIYEGDGCGGLKRVEVPMAERASLPDGIECRDATIEGQEKTIAELRAKLAAYDEASGNGAEVTDDYMTLRSNIVAIMFLTQKGKDDEVYVIAEQAMEMLDRIRAIAPKARTEAQAICPAGYCERHGVFHD